MASNAPQTHPDMRQVGGTHYAATYQHWDLIADTGMGYFEGQITKYITRWQKKSGVEDVEKAIHYFEKLISLYQEGRLLIQNRIGGVDTIRNDKYFEKFKQANQISIEECSIFIGILQYRNLHELQSVSPLLENLLNKAKG